MLNSLRKWVMVSHMGAFATSQHQLGSSLDSTVRVGKPIFPGSAGAATRTSGACWSCAHELRCDASINEPVVWQSGFARC
jgi:hypothetical protein